MKFLIPFIWLGIVSGLFAAPKSKYATVRVTDIYRDLPSTAVMLQDVREGNQAVFANKRANQFRAILEELKALQAKLEETKDQLDSEDGKKLVRSFEIKRQEAETLRNAFDEFRAEEKKRMDREMVDRMRESLGRISSAAEQLAKEQNLETVFDTSGNSNTGIPFVIYSGAAPDLTDAVQALLMNQAIEKDAQAKLDAEPEVETPEGAAPQPPLTSPLVAPPIPKP